jgi:glycerol-3-phosphate acyltransferase PlsY
MVSCLVVAVLCYLAGSFPSAWIAGRILLGEDIRRLGSGNAGATNVLRLLGWKAALPVLAVDAFKGAAAVLFLAPLGLALAAALQVPSGAAFLGIGTASVPLVCRLAAAGAALLGHAFPVFIGFRGGKGAATGAGALGALAPVVVPPCVLVFVLVVLFTRYVSLGTILAALAVVPAYVFLAPLVGGRVEPVLAVFLGAAALAVILLHRGNIRRLLRGEEKRLEGWNPPGRR